MAFRNIHAIEIFIFLSLSDISVIIAVNMKRPYLNLLLSGIATIALASCGDDEPKKTDETPTVDSTMVVEEETQVWGFDSEGGNSYQVPSPNELFAIIKESELPFQEGLISTEPGNYTSSKIQALNFGRLTADIAYTASYEKFQESITNFDNLRKVGDDLGISYVFDEFMVNRVKSNMDNADSLEVISTNSYQKIIAQLEEGEKGSTLAIIATGGFVESIYILTKMAGEFSEDNPLMQRIADQKLVMENVLDYLNIYSDDPRVQEVQEELQPISEIFSMLDEVSVSDGVSKEGERTVLGGSKIVITADEFNELTSIVETYRNAFTNPNQG